MSEQTALSPAKAIASPPIKRIHFSGNYATLKNMGYSFQKLFAGNYQQWENTGTRIWKRGSEVTIDELVNYEGYFLAALLAAQDSGTPINLDKDNDLMIIVNRHTREVGLTKADEENYLTQRIAYSSYLTELNSRFPLPPSSERSDGQTPSQWYKNEQIALAKEAGVYQAEHGLTWITMTLNELRPLLALLKKGWLSVQITERK